MNKINKNLSGQSLVSLVVFTAIAIVVTSAAIMVTLLNYQSTSSYALGEELFVLGESGLENAALRLLRNPNFANSTTTFSQVSPPISVIIGVSGGLTKTINVQSEMQNVVRRFEATGNFVGTVFTLASWRELE